MANKIVGSGYCKHCDAVVSVRLEDWGIGPYEYWGAKYIDHQYVYVCDECEEEIEDIDLYCERN